MSDARGGNDISAGFDCVPDVVADAYLRVAGYRGFYQGGCNRGEYFSESVELHSGGAGGLDGGGGSFGTGDGVGDGEKAGVGAV